MGNAIANFIRLIFIVAYTKPIVQWTNDEITFGAMIKRVLIVSLWWLLMFAVSIGIFAGVIFGISRTKVTQQHEENVPALSMAAEQINSSTNEESAPSSAQTEDISKNSQTSTEITETQADAHVDVLDAKPALLKASFPCDAAQSYSEKLICSSPDLAAADLRLSVLYKTKKTPEILRSQRKWIQERDAAELDFDAMKTKYLERINELESENNSGR